MPTEILDDHYLGFTAIVTVAMQLFFFAIAATCKFDKVTDFAGASNFVVLAVGTLVLHGTFYLRQVVVTVLVAAWGTRLAGFLLYRIIMIGEDRRFDSVRDNAVAFFGFWCFQMAWVWIVSLPCTFLNATDEDPDLTWRDYLGWGMFGVGLLCETAADQQKFFFKQDKSNTGWCDVGLWRYSRHPNYFGELLVWWGIFTSASAVFHPADLAGEADWGYACLGSPIFITVLLLLVSGIPILERSMNLRYANAQGYIEYKKSTSVLIPLPNGFYRGLNRHFKRLFCLEFNMYNVMPDTSAQAYMAVDTAQSALL